MNCNPFVSTCHSHLCRFKPPHPTTVTYLPLSSHQAYFRYSQQSYQSITNFGMIEIWRFSEWELPLVRIDSGYDERPQWFLGPELWLWWLWHSTLFAASNHFELFLATQAWCGNSVSWRRWQNDSQMHFVRNWQVIFAAETLVQNSVVLHLYGMHPMNRWIESINSDEMQMIMKRNWNWHWHVVNCFKSMNGHMHKHKRMICWAKYTNEYDTNHKNGEQTYDMRME